GGAAPGAGEPWAGPGTLTRGEDLRVVRGRPRLEVGYQKPRIKRRQSSTCRSTAGKEGYSMTPDPGIPASPGALTPEWLTRALRSTGTISDATVTACHVELFGEGKGFSGQIARVGLRYDRAEAGAPASLVAKFQFPPPDPDVREAVFHSRLYERE